VPESPSAAGVLPRQAISAGIRAGWIRSEQRIEEQHVQPASLDLTLGARAYRLRSSFLPGRRSVSEQLETFLMEEIDLREGAVLEQGRPYLVELNEELRLPKGIKARANPRSSTGRLDIFTRLLSDRGERFDEVKERYAGRLYVEVVSRSFTVRVRTGLRLNQLRFIAGEAPVSDKELIDRHEREPLVFASSTVESSEGSPVNGGLFLSVDLSRQAKLQYVGYRARRNSALIDLEQTGKYEIRDFWERVSADRQGKLILEPEDFYLLVSRERVRVPAEYAAEMAAYDPTSGELRTHYAGFFDPGFGVVSGSQLAGTAAVLEVRAHDVAFALEHGQTLCKLTFEHMQYRPDKLYGADLGSRYQRQYLALGRQFRSGSVGEMKGANSSQEELPLTLRLVAGDGDSVPMELRPGFVENGAADAPEETRR
jgi:dCTP deaminase